MRILVADDDGQMRAWLPRALRLMGHDAEAVETGAALLLRVPAFAPDVVLSDIGLPGDGIRTGLRLRRERPDIPVVLMTGDPARRAAAREEGFSRVLLKPFSLEELSAALRHFDILRGNDTPQE